MKKIIVIVSILITILVWNKGNIPKESIRFRIIANSNTEIDQATKKKIVSSISQELLRKSPTIEEERIYIKGKIPTLKEKIERITEDPFTIDYGNNYFPEKNYKGKNYKEGFYESLVITLGEGQGNNFWCILFPPLCMIDEEEDIEYHSFIKDLLKEAF